MISKIKALLKSANSEISTIIVERSIFSDKIFFDISKELGKLDNIEYAMLNNIYIFFIKNIYPKLKGIIFLDTPVDECAKRISKRNRNEEISIDKNYLELINNKTKEFINSLNINVITINGLYNYKNEEKTIVKTILNSLSHN